MKQLLMLREEGFTAKQISEILGISLEVILKCLNEEEE